MCNFQSYTGTDMKSLDDLNWNELHQTTDSILLLARELKLAVILGSIHRLSGNNKPSY